MNIFEVTDLATSRAIISILHHLDKIQGGKLTLKKKEITEHWTTSTASMRDITQAAFGLTELHFIDITSSGSITDEKIKKKRTKLISKSEIYPTSITFHINKTQYEKLRDIKFELFDYCSIQDLKNITSRFALNTLLLCLYADATMSSIVSYKLICSAMDAENSYKNRQAFLRYVVQAAFKDLSELETKPIHYTPYSEANPQTKRPMTYGAKISLS